MSELARLAAEIAAHSESPVFGVPGSGATLSLIDEIEKQNRAFILTHFEGAAGMMAGAVGRLSGRAGLCLSIKGPGLTNMVPGLAVNAFETFPMVAIAEAYGAGTAAAKAHKRIDQAILTSTVSKGITQWTGASASFAEIASLAENETPGPVILELAQPEPSSPSPLPARVLEMGKADVGKFVDLIRRSSKPIVIAGSLAIRRGWSAALNALQVPVFSTASAKGIINENRPHAAGVYTGVGLELSPERNLLSEADLVVCLGMRPSEVLATKPFGPPTINIAAVPVEGEDAFAFAATAGVQIADEALEALSKKSWGEDKVSEARRRMQGALLSDHFLPAHVFERTMAHFNGHVRAVFDTGYFCTIAEHSWRSNNASLCLMSGQGRYMGTGIPMGLGAAVYDPSVPHVVFLGDGGIGPFVGEVKLAVERKLPLLFCLLTDGYLSSIRTRAMTDKLTQRPVRIGKPSWLPVFEGFGMPVFHADSEDGFARALTSWRSADGPAFVEVSFDPDPYEAMVKGIR